MNEKGQVEVGKCFIGCAHFQSKRDEVYYQNPSDKSKINILLCGYLNRNGSFCGKNQSGFSPLAYSYDLSCQKCTSHRTQNILSFMAAAFGPLTLFYIIVVIFKISATSLYLFSYVTFSQWMVEPRNVRMVLRGTRYHPTFNIMTRFIATVYGIWNLDFSVPCILLYVSTYQHP